MHRAEHIEKLIQQRIADELLKQRSSGLYLTPEQLSERWQISLKALDKWRLKGKPPKYMKIQGGHKSAKRARNTSQITLDHYKRFITEEQFEAGERLYWDCYYAGRLPRAVTSLMDGTPPSSGGRFAGIAEGHVDCVKRYDDIQEQLRSRYIDRDRGITYWHVAYKVCIEGVAIDALENWSKWPRRSGKKLVSIVLEELYNQYNLFKRDEHNQKSK